MAGGHFGRRRSGIRNSKVYIASGVNHCGGGPGADTFDMLTPMMNWVEKGTAPWRHSCFEGQRRSHPVHPPHLRIPEVSEYNGSGNVNDAANFTCAAS